jgi:hypothetical protein
MVLTVVSKDIKSFALDVTVAYFNVRRNYNLSKDTIENEDYSYLTRRGLAKCIRDLTNIYSNRY